VQLTGNLYRDTAVIRRRGQICILIFLVICTHISTAQTCPPNIDFEEGTFSLWKCYTGFTAENGNQNLISLEPEIGPVAGRQTLYNSFPNDGLDEYGGFPINCPNGSGHSIKLGNDQGGGQAEGISYEFTIPPNENVYTLIYNYAVVFQDPAHLHFQQPRMEIEIKNVTDNVIIECSSFTFFPNGSPLPGFNLSPLSSGDAPVWYKDWSAVSINLDGNAGKRIRMFFKTADCTFRRHFGYAYIDVNSECTGRFVGASFCPDDTAVNVVAPYGYQEYKWFNSTFTQVLGNQQILWLSPPPAVGSEVAVIVKPYNGYGCLDTLYTNLLDNLVVTANAGRDTVSCNNQPVPIGGPPKPGERYRWTPAAGLTETDIANPIANPAVTTTYYLNTRSAGGGCSVFDTVTVKTALIDDNLTFEGKENFCLNNGDSAVFSVQQTDTIQWYRDDMRIPGATGPRYNAMQTGKYYARLANRSGCVVFTDYRRILIATIPVSIFTVSKAEQCLIGNIFTFSNFSTNLIGDMQYRWSFGDSTEANTREVTHTYRKAGVYTVKLIVSSNSICADSSMFTVRVFQNPVPEFTADPVCVNLPMQVISQTADTLNSPIHYNWNMGNGAVYSQAVPPPQVYSAAGVYTIQLDVFSEQCPSPVMTLTRTFSVENPRKGIRYPDQVAVENLPLDLSARLFVNAAVLWQPATNLNSPTSVTPVFTGIDPIEYTITIKTASGCITTDTQAIKIVKDIAVYVPSAFTPGNDGVNDQLRPYIIGIRKLNWFRVYNRWGQMMFQTSDAIKGWNGHFKGRMQESQTYVWILEGIGADGKTYSKKGTTILMQ
jgi:gliding motility-associated-like protein